MRRTLAGACALLLLLATPNATAGPDRVRLAQQIAEQSFGPACGGNVTVSRGDVRGLARADWRHPQGQGDNPATFYDCRITFRRGHIPWREFCTTLAHEHLHLRAWRAPPGQAFIGTREDGSRYIDAQHSRNPRSIMFPQYRGQRFAPCERSNSTASSVAASPPKTTRVAPTVLLLPGGGWQTAYPESMNAWADDFRAHGIRARAISYPLRDVPAAIEHVRRVAAAEPGPVIAYGVSAGGTIAAALAADGSVAGAVNVIGPTDFMRWPTGLVYMQQIGMTSYAQKRAASPYWRLRKGASPSLTQCGAADVLVPCDQAAAFVRAARRYQPDSRLQVMAGAHNQFPADRDRARRWVQARLSGF